jgi:drug/metabolite transporter (DMT)-like permease
VFVNLIPVSALVFAALVLGDRIHVKELIGIMLILAGVWLVNRPVVSRAPVQQEA